MGLKGPIFAYFVPKISKIKELQYFASVLVYISWASFSGVLNIGLRGLISG